MAQLSQMEFNAIREVASCHLTCSCKLSEYARACTDGVIKQMFQKAADDAKRSAQNLAQML